MQLPQTRKLHSLKYRLALWVFLPTLMISLVDVILTIRSTDRVATLVQQQLLKGSAKMISEQLTVVDGGYEISIPPAAFELFANDTHDRVFYSLRSKDGRLIAGDADLPVYPAPLQIEQEQYFISSMRGETVRMIAYAHALPSTDNNDFAVTQVAQTLHGHDAFKYDLLKLSINDNLILLAVVMAGLIITFRWTMRPLRNFGDLLLRRQPGSLEKLDENNALIELAPMIKALNDYVGRLDHTLSAYAQFVGNTAHHLRTSFALVTSQINYGMRSPGIDPVRREVLSAIQKSVSQATRVTNQLLALALVEQKQQNPQNFVEVRVADTITQVIEEMAPLAYAKGIDLGVDKLDTVAVINATPYLVYEIISNLVGNAIQHMPASGSINVSLEQDAGKVRLTVEDNGPGIAAAHRDRVFERFYRVDDSQTQSSGLGLAIVKEICDALQATVHLNTGEGGKGLRVDVLFVAA